MQDYTYYVFSHHCIVFQNWAQEICAHEAQRSQWIEHTKMEEQQIDEQMEEQIEGIDQVNAR